MSVCWYIYIYIYICLCVCVCVCVCVYVYVYSLVGMHKHTIYTFMAWVCEPVMYHLALHCSDTHR